MYRGGKGEASEVVYAVAKSGADFDSKTELPTGGRGCGVDGAADASGGLARRRGRPPGGFATGERRARTWTR